MLDNSLFRLQTVDLPQSLETRDLFVRQLHDSPAPVRATEPRPHVLIKAEESATFDTYFNSFYENYWFEFTALESVVLEIEIQGTGLVRMVRVSPQGDIYHVRESGFQSAEPTTIRFDIRDDEDFRAQAGRLWFEVDAKTDVQIFGGQWATAQEPTRDVRASVVFCTFNREEYLRGTLNNIAASPAVVDRIDQVLVVNQGSSFTAEELLPLETAATLAGTMRVIEQPNLGGCGGFTRGIWETMQQDDLSHFILLDDDIRLHADSLLRATSFLSFAEEDVALGGHMMNLHRPNFVYEAGAQLDADNLQTRPVALETDVRFGTGLDAFLQTRTVAYNGWWFFGGSRSLIDRIGYPMPCFIRGDDIEFGLRIQLAGERTVSVPGIAVWHEPFYMKLGGWQFYFEVRNRVMAAAAHNTGNWKAIQKNLRNTFVRDIAMARYHSVLFMIEALEDFAKGPDACFHTDDTALQRCRAIQAEFGPTRLADADAGTTPRKRRIAERMSRAPRLGPYAVRAQVVAGAAARLVAARQNDVPPTFPSEHVSPDQVAFLDSYVVQEQFGNGVWLFERRPQLERELWPRFLAALKQLDSHASYNAAFAETKSWESYWDELFADQLDDRLADQSG